MASAEKSACSKRIRARSSMPFSCSVAHTAACSSGSFPSAPSSTVKLDEVAAVAVKLDEVAAVESGIAALPSSPSPP